MDFTNGNLREQGLDFPLQTPEQAAEVLAELATEHHLCLYEYFLTDRVGHRGSFVEAVDLLMNLDRLLVGVLDALDLTRASLVVTSDHGNIEDMTARSHTLNPVATLVWGPIRSQFKSSPTFSLPEVAPLILKGLVG